MLHVKKNAFFIYILLLMLVSLACGVNTALPNSQNTPEVLPTGNFSNDSSALMVVSGLYPDEPLNIRNGAGGTETGQYLYNGDVVDYYHKVTVKKIDWCAISPDYTRWVACRFLSSE